MTALAPHLSAYLREHLPRERAVSPHTVKTYANCFVLLVQFAADRLKRRPTDLEIEDLGPDMIMAFLDHVETGRGSCVRTRNGRLAAIRSFFRYIEYRIPACLDLALRVRSIPTKKTDKALIDYELPPSEWSIDYDSLDQGRDEKCLP
jgi:site-specific recombinase XerC